MRRSLSALLPALGVLAVAAAPAAGRIPPPGASADLAGADVRLKGAPQESLGTSVSAAGDVNGDGLADLLAGAPGGERVYVVLGSRTASSFDAARRSGRGWAIGGEGLGAVAAGVGDVNADGLDDVAVGQPQKNRAWVVFGSRSRRDVPLRSLGRRGFAVTGAAGGSAGRALAGTGDLDRDGRADFAVAEPGRRTVWIVRGGEGPRPVALAPGRRTRVIRDVPAGAVSLAGVADVSGGGRGDLAIGTPQADGNAGRAWVVFGERTSAPVSLAAQPFGDGLALGSSGAGTFTGASVGGWGDTNGDGIPDVVVGAPGALGSPSQAPGRAFLAFGRRTPGALPAAGPGTRRISALSGPGDRTGASAGGLGDVNGDNRADVVVGAPAASRNARAGSGSALVAFGAASGDVNGASPGPAGFLVDGPSASARAGNGVSGTGDVNGDGAADVLVGAPGANQAGVLFGSLRGAAGGAPAPGSPPAPPIGQANRSPDSSITAPLAARQSAALLRRVRGTASDDFAVARVEVSLVRYAGAGARRRCAAMTRSGAFRRYRATRGSCRPAGFLRARGRQRWSLRLPRRLPAGAYVLTSRAVDATGLKELASSARDRTRVVFRVR